MNDQKGNREFKAFYEVYQKLAKGGVQNLYKGFAVSSVGTFIYRGIFFFVQENSLTKLNDANLKIHNLIQESLPTASGLIFLFKI